MMNTVKGSLKICCRSYHFHQRQSGDTTAMCASKHYEGCMAALPAR